MIALAGKAVETADTFQGTDAWGPKGPAADQAVETRTILPSVIHFIVRKDPLPIRQLRQIPDFEGICLPGAERPHSRSDGYPWDVRSFF